MKRTLSILSALALAALAVGACWWWSSHRVESALLMTPAYGVLKQYEPAGYQRILASWRDRDAGKISEADFVNGAQAQYTFAATRRLATASRPAVLALMRDTLSTARKLEQTSPEACFRYWSPEISGPADVAQTLTADDRAHTLTLMGDVVRSSAEHPEAPPAAEAVQDSLAEVINAIYAEYGTDAQMVAHPEDPRADRAKICRITNAVYERILSLPAQTGTDIIRVMAGAGKVQE